MIITKIQGGLGNQLFQYAIARNLALKNETVIGFDLSFFQFNTLDTERNYLLDKFNIVGGILTEAELKKIKNSNYAGRSIAARVISKILKTITALAPIRFRRFVGFNDIIFHPEVLDIRTEKTVYLAGNWPTEKYFIAIKDVIKNDLTLKNEMSDQAKKLQAEIDQKISVSIHIRRGDYVQNEKTKNLHGGICTLDYYQQATKLIEEKISNPTYFIFSDDIEWVKENLKLDNPVVYVSGQGIPDYEELILMSHCQHNITANSTFSWWGAWLNNKPNKIVVTPQKWFNADTDIRDLIPDGWIKL